ncbi:hypothetical protein [Methanocella sp. MCL-LM]|uniref:hypothetical protein n=1 Tax=Methanocella sp. MCL-LM TaxID=3412035 RepID=UPI003C76C9A5
MEISLFNWIAFILAFLYLLMLPGANILRTTGWVKKKGYNLPEAIVIAFGISVAILVIVSLLLALSFSIGLNFYTLMIAETLVIILTTREVVDFFRRLIKKPAA